MNSNDAQSNAARESAALLQPLELGSVNLRNRVVISPMQEYAAGPDGLARDFHFVHLGRYALGGAGLVFTEALAVVPEGRLTYSDLGIWNDTQIEPLARIADFLRSQGAAAGPRFFTPDVRHQCSGPGTVMNR